MAANDDMHVQLADHIAQCGNVHLVSLELTLERLRQAFLDASDAERPTALDRLHRRLAETQPYRVLGQYDQPVAMRSNVNGMLSAAVMVYWNIVKQ